MYLAGIDGCNAGWLIVNNLEGKYNVRIYRTFKELITDNINLDRILIDIPIGLSSLDYPRTIESKLRKELGKRASTIFNVPCRTSVYEDDNDRAKLTNKQVENKSLSIQSLNIRKKIREVDLFLQDYRQVSIYESHPEICFKYLNHNNVLLTKKSTPEGIEERLNILEKYDNYLKILFDKELKILKSGYAKRDDLIDALCLFLVNRLGIEKLNFFTDDHLFDENKIEIRVAYWQK